MLIVCGSATSWILSNLSRNKGGLYGRLTAEIKLSPFRLHECEEYFEQANVQMSQYDILQSYMVFGGIPYYLSYFQKGLSFEQNADRILFGQKPRLHDEYNRLFAAIFNNPEESKKVVNLLATRHTGFTREEISRLADIPIGGGLSCTLAALVESDFKYPIYHQQGRRHAPAPPYRSTKKHIVAQTNHPPHDDNHIRSGHWQVQRHCAERSMYGRLVPLITTRNRFPHSTIMPLWQTKLSAQGARAGG